MTIFRNRSEAHEIKVYHCNLIIYLVCYISLKSPHSDNNLNEVIFVLPSAKYEKIIEFMCEYKKINRDELFKILKDQQCKYLMLLLLNKHKCIDKSMINNYFPSYSKQAMNYGFRKAQEKFLINKDFRELYFEIEDDIKKSL